MKTIVTDNLDDFGKGLSLSDLEKVVVEIPQRCLRETSMSNFTRVFGHIIGEKDNSYFLFTTYGYIGPIDKKDLIFVNYHRDWPTIQ